MILSVENNLDRLPFTQFSFLSSTVQAGSGTIPVKNLGIFNGQYALQIGKTGEAQSEIVVNSSIGTALVTSNTKYPHLQDTPIFQIHYDKVIFKRSVNGTAGTAVGFATVPITPDSFYTEYNDTSGVATYAYKTQFTNSVTGDLSNESDWFVPGGPSFYSLQRLRGRIKHDLYSAQFIKDDNTIADWINEWIEVMTNSALEVNEGYQLGVVSYSFGTAGTVSIADPLFKYANKIEVTYDGQNYSNSTEIPQRSFDTNDVFSKTSPRHYWLGNTALGILPAGVSGTVRMTLGEIATEMVNEIDELPQFLKSYTTGCIEYALYKAYDLDQKGADADRHFQKFVMYQNKFVEQITPRDFTGPKTIDFVDSVSGRNEDVDLSVEYFI